MTVAAFGGAESFMLMDWRANSAPENRPPNAGVGSALGFFTAPRALIWFAVKTPLVGANLRMWKTYSARWKRRRTHRERQARQIKSLHVR